MSQSYENEINKLLPLLEDCKDRRQIISRMARQAILRPQYFPVYQDTFFGSKASACRKARKELSKKFENYAERTEKFYDKITGSDLYYQVRTILNKHNVAYTECKSKISYPYYYFDYDPKSDHWNDQFEEGCNEVEHTLDSMIEFFKVAIETLQSNSFRAAAPKE